jgi:hypothetical protein
MKNNIENYLEVGVSRLNALGGQWISWDATQARKNHTDEFGHSIKPGEYYYNRSNGPGWQNVVKLSEVSMANFIYLYFLTTPKLKDKADKIIKEREY